MTLDELKNYRSVCAKLEKIKSNIEMHKIPITVQKSKDEIPWNKRTAVFYELPGTKEVKELLAEEAAKMKQKNDIEKFIESQDDEMRFILERKAYDGWSNLRIAMKLGYKDEGTIRKKIKKIL